MPQSLVANSFLKALRTAKEVEKGREEERLSVAKNMLEIGLPLDTIRKATGLTLEQIQKLQSYPDFFLGKHTKAPFSGALSVLGILFPCQDFASNFQSFCA